MKTGARHACRPLLDSVTMVRNVRPSRYAAETRVWSCTFTPADPAALKRARLGLRRASRESSLLIPMRTRLHLSKEQGERPREVCAWRVPPPLLRCLQTASLLAAGALSLVPAFAQEPTAVLPEKHQALLKEHCLSCHDAEKQKGKFRVDELPLAITDNLSAERWQKVLNALNSGEMPPDRKSVV